MIFEKVTFKQPVDEKIMTKNNLCKDPNLCNRLDFCFSLLAFHVSLNTFDVWRTDLSPPPPLTLRGFCDVMSPFTCNKGVLDAKAEAFQLLVTGELDPHETPRGCNEARILPTTEAINERREPKRPIAYFDVIKAALERWLDVVIFVKSQLNPLSRESFGKQGRGRKQRKKIHEKKMTIVAFAGQR